jgi:hypothetical protein
MGPERNASRTPAVARRPVPVRTPIVPAARAVPTGTVLRQRLGNQGTQALATRVVARAAAPKSMPDGAAAVGGFSISHPDDAHEREAERVADVVMRSADPGAVSPSAASPTVQRTCAACEEELSERAQVDRSAAASGASDAPTPVAANIRDMQGGGTPLPAATRAFFEPRFGADFGHVRVHTGARADATAKAISAKAFTVGPDIVFAGGQFAPESKEGQRLLAHELTHVVQQDGGASRVSRQAAHVDPGISAFARTPTLQRFDLPFGYETDFSWEGVKTAAGVVRDKAEDALNWIVEQITDLANEAKAWLGEQWDNLKALMWSAFNAAKDAFGKLTAFFLSPLGLLGEALMHLDPAALSKSWAAFSAVVARVGNGFKTMAAGLLRPFEATWRFIDRRVTWVLDKLAGLLGNVLFRKLPNLVQRGARLLVDALKSLWTTVSAAWRQLFGQIKAWVDAAIDAVVGFMQKVVTFAIDVVIATLVKIGQMVLFLRDFFSDPMKYIALLGKRCVQALDGVERRFAGVVSQYFGSARATATPAPATAAPMQLHRAPASTATAEARTTASWGEIGDGILDVMGEKWEAFKASPMTVVVGLLKDLFLPLVGNVEDAIKLYHDIKKVVTGLNFDSLHDLWTSLLQILDIPILIYNTVVSMLMRTLMLPLLIASFVPVAREAAMAIGFELLMAFLAGVGANLAQKLLLLKTGATARHQKKDAYNSIADNLIALAITAVIVLLMVLLPAIYGLMKGIYNFVKGKVFGIKIPPIEGKSPALPENKPKPPEDKARKPPEKNEPKPREPDLGYENGKRVVAEETTADGKHKIKVTEDGVCLRCSDCGTLIKDYAIELNDPKNAALLAELEAAETTANPKLKALKMVKIEEKLAEIRKNNPHPNDPTLARAARIEILGKDPAQGGKVTPSTLREAEVAVSLEEAGQVKGPIRRDPTGGADFIAGDGKPWDVKGFDSGHPPAQGGFELATDAAKVDKSLSLGEDVMLDTGKMSAADTAALKAEGVKRGWGDRVKFFP